MDGLHLCIFVRSARGREGGPRGGGGDAVEKAGFPESIPTLVYQPLLCGNDVARVPAQLRLSLLLANV